MNLLTEVLTEPTIVRDWQASQWNTLMPLVRRARLVGRCRALFIELFDKQRHKRNFPM